MKRTQAIIEQAAPNGAVSIFFKDHTFSMRFNLGGMNEGWWHEGFRITRDEAEAILEQHEIRKTYKS